MTRWRSRNAKKKGSENKLFLDLIGNNARISVLFQETEFECQRCDLYIKVNINPFMVCQEVNLSFLQALDTGI